MLTRGFSLICSSEQERKTPGMLELDDKILRSLRIAGDVPLDVPPARPIKLDISSAPDKAGGHIASITSCDGIQGGKIQSWLSSSTDTFRRKKSPLFCLKSVEKQIFHSTHNIR